MKELGHFSVVRLVRVPPFLVLVVNRDTLHSDHAWTGESTAWKSAAETINYHVQSVKEGYRLPDAIHYLSDLKARSSQPPSTAQDDSDAVADAFRDESPAVEEARNNLLRHGESHTGPSSEVLQLFRNSLVAAVVLNGPLAVPGKVTLVRVFKAFFESWKSER